LGGGPLLKESWLQKEGRYLVFSKKHAMLPMRLPKIKQMN
jgi:hypothetical protein